MKNRDEADFWSVNSRLDTLQAAFLSIKLRGLKEVNAKRREIVLKYSSALNNVVTVPTERPDEIPVYHTYVIRAARRDQLQAWLGENGIETKVHYPVPIHLQPAFGGTAGSFPEAERQAAEILTLPVHQGLSDDQVAHVISSVQGFYEGPGSGR
jgi:dTDP-4-amino-4,6-dideoxygalactose transaminase